MDRTVIEPKRVEQISRKTIAPKQEENSGCKITINYGIMLGMTTREQDDRLLNHIMVYGFSLAFGIVFASLQALKPTPAGFTIEMSWWTLIVLVVGAGIMAPCFHLILHSERRYVRRAALAVVVLLGLGAFFYPMRMVPQEKFRAIFTGLAVAAAALSFLAGLLLVLHRFFESDEKRSQG